MIEEIEKWLKNLEERKVEIVQEGFMTSKICIENLKYEIQYDNLNLKDKEKDIYISFNLNQVYEIQMQNNILIFYLDNDIKIKIVNSKK